MTWSIVARSADAAFGVAVASKAFAVGALCPYARSGVGALSTATSERIRAGAADAERTLTSASSAAVNLLKQNTGEMEG